MGIMRSIVDWCDNKMNEALEEENERKAYGKAVASGVVEGFCDAAILCYIPVVIACYVYQNKLANK